MIAAAITRRLNVDPLMRTRLGGASVTGTLTPFPTPLGSHQNSTFARAPMAFEPGLVTLSPSQAILRSASEWLTPILQRVLQRPIPTGGCWCTNILTMSIRIVPDEDQPSASIEIALEKSLPDYDLEVMEQPTPRHVDAILVSQGFRDLVDDTRGILMDLLAQHPPHHPRSEEHTSELQSLTN